MKTKTEEITPIKNRIKLSRQDLIFETVSYVILSIILIVVLYPIYFVFIASFSDPTLVNAGKVVLFPRNIMLDGYKQVFSYTQLWVGYRNTIIYTLVGSTLNVLLTMLTAYPMSRKKFYGKSFFLGFMMFTMYFSGGLIPSYLVNQTLGLVNDWKIMVISGMISISNVIIAMTFMRNSIPDELYEAAQVDGLSHFGTFSKIVVPLSKPIIAVLCLYYGVGHWNNYWTAMIYITDSNLYPLQLVLRGILTLNQIDSSLLMDVEDVNRMRNMAELMKYGMIIVSSAPLIIIYPFLQKHFEKGVMIGSVKG